jgi:hypothetical protein
MRLGSVSLSGLLWLALGSAGCASTTAAAMVGDDAALQRAATHPGLAGCTAAPTEIGRVQSRELDEISGIVESRVTPGVFFVHNDSGDSPRFFALNASGALLAELELDDVSVLIDAEDIASGPAPGGGTYLYVGDTGNNFASMGVGIPRRKAVLYRVPEPAIRLDARGVKLELRGAFPIVFTFPDGARDVEAFFVDPRSGDLFMISKQLDGHSQVLGASASVLGAGGGKLRLLGALQFGSGSLPGSTMPTAASVSPDGSVILVRTYDSVFAFRRGPAESVLDALSRPPVREAAPREAQGEAIGVVGNGAAFITISEGIEPAVNCGLLAPSPTQN